jgi:hypothetical protein
VRRHAEASRLLYASDDVFVFLRSYALLAQRLTDLSKMAHAVIEGGGVGAPGQFCSTTLASVLSIIHLPSLTLPCLALPCLAFATKHSRFFFRYLFDSLSSKGGDPAYVATRPYLTLPCLCYQTIMFYFLFSITSPGGVPAYAATLPPQPHSAVGAAQTQNTLAAATALPKAETAAEIERRVLEACAGVVAGVVSARSFETLVRNEVGAEGHRLFLLPHCVTTVVARMQALTQVSVMHLFSCAFVNNFTLYSLYSIPLCALRYDGGRKDARLTQVGAVTLASFSHTCFFQSHLLLSITIAPFNHTCFF